MEIDQHQLDLKQLHPDWILSLEGKSITRKISTRDFNHSLALVRQVAELAEKINHHPDIALGWGYCNISYTTHSISRLSELDFRCAEQVDALLSTT